LGRCFPRPGPNHSSRVDREEPPAIFRPLRDAGLPGRYPKAPVAELVDALDSKSSSARSAGSIPARGTNLRSFGWQAARAPTSDSVVKQPTPPKHRHCERSEAIHSFFAWRDGLLRFARNDDIHALFRVLAARRARVFARTSSLPNQRAQGKPGARCTRGRAWSVVNTRVSHHRFTGTPGLPCAMVLTVSSALSSVTGLVCHRRSQEACFPGT
jgi:hypothetical protein